jgi:hypothetical protein
MTRLFVLFLVAMAALTHVAWGQIDPWTPLIFPQIVEGGTFTTTLVLINPGGVPANVSVGCWNDAGIGIDIAGLTGFAIRLMPNNTMKIQAVNNDASIRTGWCSVTANIPVFGQLTFVSQNGDTVLNGVGVPPSRLVRSFTVAVNLGATSNVGLALVNPNGSTANVSCRYLNETGGPNGSFEINLPPYGHRAKFVTEFLPTLGPGASGQIFCSASLDIAGIGLGIDSGQLWSIPVFRIP